jgi:hypothetical protein
VIPTIARAVPRQRTMLRGQVVSVARTEAPWARTDVTLDDGTGTLVLRFLGRASVPGLEPGRRVVVDGTPGFMDRTLVMLNPIYSFDETG